MAKRNSDILRVDADFKKFVESLSRFKANQEGIKIPPSRITKAMFNQYQKYPKLLDEMNLSKLGNINKK